MICSPNTMKIITRSILLFVFILLTYVSGYAKPDPKPPKPPKDKNVPIDENLILLGFVAVSFGSYSIYKKYKPIKKSV